MPIMTHRRSRAWPVERNHTAFTQQLPDRRIWCAGGALTACPPRESVGNQQIQTGSVTRIADLPVNHQIEHRGGGHLDVACLDDSAAAVGQIARLQHAVPEIE
ncbi:hypothetical protein WR25_25736 [Diploscapter pachys]|uniref:Uncharacterized protein n=1 Tax=Diploscapter pachys TaxID=2018661 RepID=A0A2A2K3J7_9BILA|nr:hypothetical protein WR25_25736 [Diploscapter pachys]